VLVVTALLLGASSQAAALDFDLSGRVQEDVAWFSGSGKKQGTANQFANGANLKRADLFAKGSLGRDDLSFHTQYRLSGTADGASHVQSAHVRWDCENLHVRFGQMNDVPFGMDNTASSSNLMFMERSAASDLVSLRNQSATSQGDRSWFGLNGGFMNDMYTFNLSVVTLGLAEVSDNSNSDKWNYMARATVAPMQGDDGTLHFGLNYKHRKYNNETFNQGVAAANWTGIGVGLEVGGRSNPNEANLNTVHLRAADILTSENIFGFEVAGAYNGLVVQGEYFSNKYKFNGTTAEQQAKTWYLQGSYVLTGEARAYDLASGNFKNPTPSGDVGAWELALRYTNVDLTRKGANNLAPLAAGNVNNGPSVGTVNTNGGKAKLWTVGLNYFATEQLRLQANYNRGKFTFAPTTVGDRKIAAFGLGLQYLFG